MGFLGSKKIVKPGVCPECYRDMDSLGELETGNIIYRCAGEDSCNADYIFDIKNKSYSLNRRTQQ